MTRKKSGFIILTGAFILMIIALTSLDGWAFTESYIRKLTDARAKARMHSCKANLKMLDGATQIWQLDTGNPENAIPMWEDLIPVYMRKKPICSAGGEYTMGNSTIFPTCSIGDNGTDIPEDDHSIGEKDAMRF